MGGNQSNIKGHELERAVEAIERAILAEDPSLSGREIAITPRHRISCDGVTHEIDLHVVIRAAGGYDSIHIFECKNWRKPVGKNEVIVFSAKIEACGAQRGFLVAAQFTKAARAQAKKNQRICLLLARKIDPEALCAPLHMRCTFLIGMDLVWSLYRPEGEESVQGTPKVRMSGGAAEVARIARVGEVLVSISHVETFAAATALGCHCAWRSRCTLPSSWPLLRRARSRPRGLKRTSRPTSPSRRSGRRAW